MASLSGDQKQKLYILAGFLGVLVLVGFFALRSPDDEGGDALAQAPTTAAPAPAGGSAPPPGAAPAAAPAPAPTPDAKTVAKAKTVVAKAPVIPAPKRASLAPSREDPFEPFFYPTPIPEPTPTPMPPPVPLPPPVNIPPPPAVSLPAARLASLPPNTVLRGLPRPHIAQYNPLPGPLWIGRGNRVTAPNEVPIRSGNKRLSGVIIGDSVRALLEITVADAGGGAAAEGGVAASNTIVRVVQPGDEVDGIRILRIERIYEGGRQITRMTVREGNEERFVDLRQSPNPPAALGTGGTSSEGGPPSPPGSFGAIRPVPGRSPRIID